jgi:hypothetical protein
VNGRCGAICDLIRGRVTRSQVGPSSVANERQDGIIPDRRAGAARQESARHSDIQFGRLRGPNDHRLRHEVQKGRIHRSVTQTGGVDRRIPVPEGSRECLSRPVLCHSLLERARDGPLIHFIPCSSIAARRTVRRRDPNRGSRTAHRILSASPEQPVPDPQSPKFSSWGTTASASQIQTPIILTAAVIRKNIARPS